MVNLNDIKIELLTETAEALPNLSDEDYFGEKYKDYVSNSLLTLLNPEQEGSPLKFLSGFKEKKSKGSLELGSAVHQLILEPDKHVLSEVTKPTGKIGDIMECIHKRVKDGYTYNEAMELAFVECDYYKGKITEEKKETVHTKGIEYYTYLLARDSEETKSIILKDSDLEKLNNCVKSVNENVICKQLLFPKEKEGLISFNEFVIIMDAKALLPLDDDLKSPVVDFKLKCKIDNFSVDFNTKTINLNDLKTTGYSIDKFVGYTVDKIDGERNYSYFMKGSFQKFHYQRQMAMYKSLLFSYLTNTDSRIDDTWTFNTHMVVVETNEPYMSCVYKVSDRWLNDGDYEFKQLLKRLSYHKEYGFDSFINIDVNKIIEF